MKNVLVFAFMKIKGSALQEEREGERERWIRIQRKKEIGLGRRRDKDIERGRE